MESLGEKIKRLSDEIDADTLEFASDEELLEYLFLVNKLKLKLEDLVNLEKESEKK